MYIYRPHRSTLEEAMKEATEYKSLGEVQERVIRDWHFVPGYAEFTEHDVTFAGPAHDDDRIGWKNVQYVMLNDHVCGMVGEKTYKKYVGKHVKSWEIPDARPGACFHGEVWIHCPCCGKGIELHGLKPERIIGNYSVYMCGNCGELFKRI